MATKQPLHLISDFTKIIGDVDYNISLYNDILKTYNKWMHKMRPQDRRVLITFLRYNIIDYIWRFEEYMLMDKSDRRRITEYSMKLRYGDIEGQLRWDKYRNKQAVSNTFEYKSTKHGWDKQQFDEYNKSRSVTENNLINRHGDKKGRDKFNKYVERQGHAGCSEQYFIDKYGEVKGKQFYLDLNKKKGITEENFIRKYGKTEGISLFNKCMLSRSVTGKHYSNLSQTVFNEMVERCITGDHLDYIFYNDKNYEYLFNKSGHTVVFVDFYDALNKRVIEFHGDYWHCNPDKYDKEFTNTKTKLTAEETWEKDKLREIYLRENFDVDYFVIWEQDWMHDKETVIEQVKEYLCK